MSYGHTVASKEPLEMNKPLYLIALRIQVVSTLLWTKSTSLQQLLESKFLHLAHLCINSPSTFLLEKYLFVVLYTSFNRALYFDSMSNEHCNWLLWYFWHKKRNLSFDQKKERRNLSVLQFRNFTWNSNFKIWVFFNS